MVLKEKISKYNTHSLPIYLYQRLSVECDFDVLRGNHVRADSVRPHTVDMLGLALPSLKPPRQYLSSIAKDLKSVLTLE